MESMRQGGTWRATNAIVEGDLEPELVCRTLHRAMEKIP
jgi:hypothetical protein